jgi:Na+/H+ antiporter NhaD/arsenite permease-like protein
MRVRIPVITWLVLTIMLAFVAVEPAWASAEGERGEDLGSKLPLWSVLPFLGILLSIALFPLFKPHFWHQNYPKVAAFWALLLAVPFVVVFRGEAMHAILHTYLREYFPFIILLWSLFTVAGGVVVRGSISGSPNSNLALLTIGTLIASWTGTTGASMLLIHPLLRALENRRHRAHTVIFFIFLVSNIGGALTPLGDPPLFLGFLNGVPFFWTMHLLPHMLLLSGMLLAMYYVLDRRLYAREVMEGSVTPTLDLETVRLDGLRNLPLLGGIVGFVLLSGILHWDEVDVLGIAIPGQDLLRDAALVVLGLISLRVTPHALRAANKFTWEPIREVAYLFAAIFMTIIPALQILHAGEEGQLGFIIRMVNQPVEYFWITGALSAFLDNAPTYLTFLNTALGKFHAGMPTREAVHLLIQEHEAVLEGISAGAVFLGAMTYIGNAPNFMVRSIAEERGVAMPSFMGFLVRWALPILGPCLVVITVVFFV